MILTLERLKAQLGGIQTKLNFDTVLPFVQVAERGFRREVGAELYQYLHELDNPITTLADLLDLACGCIAWAAYDLALPHLKIRVGDLGMMKTAPANTTAITKWEYVDTREANLAMADLLWETFWETLEELRPSAWTNSEAYQLRNTYFLRSADELTRYLPLVGRNRRFFTVLTQYIHRAEQLYIADLTTEAVFDTLKEKWQNKSSTLTAAEEKLVERIRQALAPLALYEAYPYLPIKMDEKGLREIRNKDGTLEEEIADRPYRQAQRRQLWQDGQLYLARLRNFLDQTATALVFPQYRLAHPLDVPGQDFEDFTDFSHVII